MLVLDRKQTESIDIEGVRVRVLRIGRKYVKLGIEAPEGVRVMRTELLTKEKPSEIESA